MKIKKVAAGLFNNKDAVKLKELVTRGLLTGEQLKSVNIRAKKEDKHPVEVILSDKILGSEPMLEALAVLYDLPPVMLNRQVIVPRTINLLPREMSAQHDLVIFKKTGPKVHVATITPNHRRLMDFVKKKTGFTPVPYLATKSGIRHALKRYQGDIKEDFSIIIENSVQEALAAEAGAENMAQFIPIIRTVDLIVNRGIASGASDIHIEPQHNRIIIRFRIDGILHKIVELPKEILPALVTRIKIMANLKIDEHQVPQDGRFQFKHNDQRLAVRVSIIPTLHGAKAALRLLEMKEKTFTLYKLGLNKRDQDIFKQELGASQGMILVTGPTGSGKTTTLYTLLRMLNQEGVNICTIEDPIEYGVDNINQMQVRPQTGLTFAAGLRALMRQDPNIVMVGEIRDAETATIAANAAMTGHLVLSTLHTNNAFLTPQRLVEMGLQPFLVSSVLNLMIGQRLVRRLCTHCRVRMRSTDKIPEEYGPQLPVRETFAKLQSLRLLDSGTRLEDVHVYRSRGCGRCNQTGYRGRMGIYESVPVDDELKSIIVSDSSEQNVKLQAIRKGALTMMEDGLLKVFEGKTTVDEVLRVTKD